ncbi:Uncharacterized protein Fot_06662 [Forsythia ovata]|uniref:Uncharacterized protein n=1 Tax=Forsythia ovata TaxID=205694 RepID=A0ABD1WWH2_9LAMI
MSMRGRADRVECEVEALVDTEVRTTVDGDQEEAVDIGVDTTVEGEAEVAEDTWVGTSVEGDAEEADQPHRWTTRSVRQKDSKRKAVENLDIDEQLQETRVKKPSQWVTSPYTTEGQWIKHVDATAFDLFRDVDPVKDKEFSAWYNQLGDG